MPVELAVLISAVSAITGLLKESKDAVGKIGWLGGAAGKREADEKLGQLQQRLRDAGELARIGEEQCHTHRTVLDLLSQARGVRRFLTERADDLKDESDAGYEGGWGWLALAFESLDGRRDPMREAVQGRLQYLDASDQSSIPGYLSDFDVAFGQAREHVSNRSALLLSPRLDTMIEQLQRVETALFDTITRKVLGELRRLGM